MSARKIVPMSFLVEVCSEGPTGENWTNLLVVLHRDDFEPIRQHLEGGGSTQISRQGDVLRLRWSALGLELPIRLGMPFRLPFEDSQRTIFELVADSSVGFGITARLEDGRHAEPIFLDLHGNLEAIQARRKGKPRKTYSLKDYWVAYMRGGPRIEI